MGCLYKIDFPSGKSYIGVTVGTAEQRFAEHVYNAKRGLARGINRAMRKYGAESAKLTTLVIADDWDFLLMLERDAIAKYQTKGPHGYNMTDGGEGALGYKHTEESLLKMSAIHKGKAHHNMPHSAEAKAKMAAAKLGTKRSEETKAKIGAASKGNKHALGKVQSEESRMRKSVALTGQRRTPEQRANISAAAKIREESKRANRGISWT